MQVQSDIPRPAMAVKPFLVTNAQRKRVQTFRQRLPYRLSILYKHRRFMSIQRIFVISRNRTTNRLHLTPTIESFINNEQARQCIHNKRTAMKQQEAKYSSYMFTLYYKIV